MDAKIAPSGFQQQATHGVRHAADTHLQAGAILHFSRDLMRHGAVHVGGRGIDQNDMRRGSGVDHEIHFADMHAILDAKHIGQRGVRLDNDDPGAFDDGAQPDLRGGEIEHAVLVHRAGLDDQDIGRIDKAAVIIRHLAELHRKMRAAALIGLAAIVGREKRAEPLEMLASRVRFQHSARPQAEAGTDFNVVQFGGVLGQGSIEGVGLCLRESVVQPHAGPHQSGGAARLQPHSSRRRPARRWFGPWRR